MFKLNFQTVQQVFNVFLNLNIILTSNKSYLGSSLTHSYLEACKRVISGAEKSKKFPLAHRTSEKENHLSGRKTCLPRFFVSQK